MLLQVSVDPLLKMIDLKTCIYLIYVQESRMVTDTFQCMQFLRINYKCFHKICLSVLHRISDPLGRFLWAASLTSGNVLTYIYIYCRWIRIMFQDSTFRKQLVISNFWLQSKMDCQFGCDFRKCVLSSIAQQQ